MHFASFFSGEFITAIVVNQLKRKLAKHTSVWCKVVIYLVFLLTKNTLSLEKSFKDKKCQARPTKAIKDQKHKDIFKFMNYQP